MRGLKSTIVSTNKLMKLVHFPEQPPVTTCRRIPGKYSTLIQIFIVFVFMMNFAIGDAICVGLSTLAKRAGLIGFVLQQLALFCKVLCYCALFCTALYCFARFCTILNWVCFATVPIFLGLCHQRLVCTSCSTSTTFLGNLQKYFWRNLKSPLFSILGVRSIIGFWL